MTNDQPKAPMSAEQYIVDNWGHEWASKLEWPAGDVIDALEEYASHACTEKQSELDNVWSELKGMQSKYEKVVADKQAEIDSLRVTINNMGLNLSEEQKMHGCTKNKLLFAHSTELPAKDSEYEELKAKTDILKSDLSIQKSNHEHLHKTCNENYKLASDFKLKYQQLKARAESLFREMQIIRDYKFFGQFDAINIAFLADRAIKEYEQNVSLIDKGNKSK